MGRPRCPHGREICWDCVVVDDAAKRAFDTVRLMAVSTDFETRTRQSPYVAIRLIDGSCDGVMYDTKRDAVRHQLHEMSCAYFSFRNSPNGFPSAKDAAVFLLWNRVAYDNGFRLPDPDGQHGGPDLVMPDMREHLTNQLRRLIGGRRA